MDTRFQGKKDRRARAAVGWWYRLLPPRVRAIKRPEVAVTGFIACFFILFYLINLTYDFESVVREYLGYVRFAGAILVLLLIYIKMDRFPLWIGYLGALTELVAFGYFVGLSSDFEQIAFRLQEFPLITLYLAWLFDPRLVRGTIYPVLAGTLYLAYFYGPQSGMALHSGWLNVLSLLLLTIGASVIGSYVKARFHYQSEVDELTGAVNRRGLQLRGELLLASFQRSRRPLAAALLDMDKFKAINDEGGHEAGDRALKALVAHLEATTRRNDLVARLGGDEFVILFPSTTRTQAQLLMARVQGSSSQAWSFGVAQARKDDNLSTMILRADRDMYASKRDRAAREG
ncbi:GGDEF domain-containing protein [Arthrobacter sp. S41]|uniref:GGDEF domain-containing protein n=1 Tax=Arthrobacter sp. S41 TaxID=2509721 RepID=UPI0010359383|nr:GGDEF domain-containing protein [Arthrobacter sp. S41]TAP28596.1 GGDEF domain-containing protein [Arthrobacter sp. S41]